MIRIHFLHVPAGFIIAPSRPSFGCVEEESRLSHSYVRHPLSDNEPAVPVGMTNVVLRTGNWTLALIHVAFL